MQGTYNTNNLRLKGQKRILKAKKCQYPILPNGGEEDVSYDADKTSGDDPEVLGHCQVVEDSEHHHHVPKTEEAVLELTEHFLVVFEFEHSVDESEDYRQHDYSQSEGIEQRPPGGRPSQAELDPSAMMKIRISNPVRSDISSWWRMAPTTVRMSV